MWWNVTKYCKTYPNVATCAHLSCGEKPLAETATCPTLWSVPVGYSRWGTSACVSLHFTAAVRCDMVYIRRFERDTYEKNGIGGEARHGVTSGVSCETSLNKHVTPHLHREYTRSPLEDPPSFRTKPLKILRHYLWTNGFLSNPAPGENHLSGHLVMETGCNTCLHLSLSLSIALSIYRSLSQSISLSLYIYIYL